MKTKGYEMRLYTLQEVADICKITLGTLYNHISQGRLRTFKKTYRWGKRISFVTEKDFQRYLYNYFFDNKDKKKLLSKTKKIKVKDNAKQ